MLFSANRSVSGRERGIANLQLSIDGAWWYITDSNNWGSMCKVVARTLCHENDERRGAAARARAGRLRA